MEELLYRLKERTFSLFNSESRFTRLLSRFLALAFAAAVVSTIAPTLADELATSPSMQQLAAPVQTVNPDPSSSPTNSETVTPTGTPMPTPTIIRPSISANSQPDLSQPSDSATSIDEPAKPLEIQPRYSLQIPLTVAVDPRAMTAFLPHINAVAPDADFTLACISSKSLALDILTKKASTLAPMGPDFILGDRTNELLVSGSTERVIALINSYGGLFAYTGDKGISGSSIQFSFVAVSKPVLQADFCSAARAIGIATFRSLGLEQSTVKGQGSLKK